MNVEADNILKRIRKAMGWSQEHLASLLDVSCASVRAYEAGRRPSIPVLKRLLHIATKHASPPLAAAVEAEMRGLVDAAEIDRIKADARHMVHGVDREKLHEILDSILDGGYPQAIRAATIVLEGLLGWRPNA